MTSLQNLKNSKGIFFKQQSRNCKFNIKSIQRIVHLTMALIFIGQLQLSANVYGQRITLKRNHLTLNELFKAIKQQTGYDVVWQSDQLNPLKTIDANFINSPLIEVINYSLIGHDMNFKIDQHSIIIRKNFKNIVSDYSMQDSVIYKGKVVDEKGLPLPGATIYIKGSGKGRVSNSEGNFVIYGPKKGTLTITFLGYLTKDITLNGLNPLELITVSMKPGQNQLGEVNIFSTGYQDLPRERATGSFEVVTKEQLQHSTDPNLIRRLEGITTSMNFNNQLIPNSSVSYNGGGSFGRLTGVAQRSPITNLTIRGRNTLNVVNTPSNSSGQVLVVIDGIASPYSVDQIDPNDVESITILKDAAAASIWGARAANGVIVIKTKRGTYERPLSISFNTNFNITDKIDLFYKKFMSTSDFVDAQIFQFNASNTNIPQPNIASAQTLRSPVAEILNDEKNGIITSDEAGRQINLLRNNDVRKDLDKYVNRSLIAQNYSIAFDGGSRFVAYRLSGAYNKTLNNSLNSDQNRISLNYGVSVKPFKNMEIQTNLTYSKSKTNDQAGQNTIPTTPGGAYYPYTKLVDENGNYSSIPYKYRPAFIDLLRNTYKDKVLDYSFTPLKDIDEGFSKTSIQNFNFNFNTSYKLLNFISANLGYNYNRGYNEQDLLYRDNSFYMRDLINTYTNGFTLVRNIPLGGLYLPTISKTNNQTIRGQLNVNKQWSGNHTLDAVIGMDLTQNYSYFRGDQYYGYNEAKKTSQNNLNFSSILPLLFADELTGLAFAPLLNQASGINSIRLRTVSTYANAAYTFKNKYSFSGSIRKDLNSEFGYGTNKGGTPFYSVGASWNIANESFYKSSFLPRLALRTTFGYNGNVNPLVTARPIIGYSLSQDFNNRLFYANTIDDQGTTNRNLKPEKTAVLNFGLDFGFRNNRISGSLEYYDKKTTDLLSSGSLDPSTGFSTSIYNIASLHGWGTDFTLNSRNLQSNLFMWTTNFLFSYNRVKVEKLYNKGASTSGQVIESNSLYNEGADLSRVYAYKWAGLDPITGDPRGYLDNQLLNISNTFDGSSNYAKITNSPISSARYFGSRVPVYFGSLRNTFSYGQLSLSLNLLYKLGYYFRRPISDVVSYNRLTRDNLLLGIEYASRWQKPGDELVTNVPSFTYPTDGNRDSFYYFSEINVQKA
ncbi:SusC/RagA family TonB-linked outer membrane protein, partial [Pedobacter sp. MR2016-24]|uniref:SusC/RagA family TonB-linked outer membrane protein n=1 Tax=Pedobacter sp. MR2016-24 TaxID=2994466 RepID=UPI0022483626